MTQYPLFDLPPASRDIPRTDHLSHRLWTENKAEIVSEYLSRFVLITKHGTYIDGFAGMHDRPESWAAKRVLEVNPPWLRRFYLYDIDQAKAQGLIDLARQYPDREIVVQCADFNEEIAALLESGVIGPREATFCMLDQYTFECDWATVRRLAQHPKAEFKIEIFYFLANKWLDRALGGSRSDRRRVSDWWGSSDWQFLKDLSGTQRARCVQERFEDELLYASAIAWPIYEKGGAGQITYFMIHASDHPRAPKLMKQAYGSIIPRIEDVPIFDLDAFP